MNGQHRLSVDNLSRDGTVSFWKSAEAFIAVALYIK